MTQKLLLLVVLILVAGLAIGFFAGLLYSNYRLAVLSEGRAFISYGGGDIIWPISSGPPPTPIEISGGWRTPVPTATPTKTSTPKPTPTPITDCKSLVQIYTYMYDIYYDLACLRNLNPRSRDLFSLKLNEVLNKFDTQECKETLIRSRACPDGQDPVF